MSDAPACDDAALAAPRPAAARALFAASEALLRAERRAIAALMALLALLILVNVATRYAGAPIYWIDETAVYATVWLTFVGASAMTRLRLDFAVTLVTDLLGPRAARAARALATLCTTLFALGLLLMCWVWLDPPGIAAAGFDAREYAAGSFNFLYTERTQTLGWPSWILYLAVPLGAAGMSVHAAANLAEHLGLAPPAPPRPGLSANAETVA